MLLGLADVGAAAKLSLRAGRLRTEVVAEVGGLPLDAPVGGQLEALLRTAVRLHLDLGHDGARKYIDLEPLGKRFHASSITLPHRPLVQPFLMPFLMPFLVSFLVPFLVPFY